MRNYVFSLYANILTNKEETAMFSNIAVNKNETLK